MASAPAVGLGNLASGPGQGQAGAQGGQKLLPSALAKGLTPVHTRGQAEEGTPIFEVLDADLDESAQVMVKRLSEHLEQVLKVQEEIGKMHLGLDQLRVAVAEPWAKEDDANTKDNGKGGKGGKGKGDKKSPTTPKSPKSPKSPTSPLSPLNPRSPRKGQPATPGRKESDKSKTSTAEPNETLAKREKGVEEIMARVCPPGEDT